MTVVRLERVEPAVALFEQMVEIERNCGLEPFSVELLRECVLRMDTFVCMDGDTVAGFITVLPNGEYFGECLYIFNLNVAKRYRRQGLGRRLIQTACATYEKTHGGMSVTLDVTRTNEAALALYRSLGFVETDYPSENGPGDMVMKVPLVELLKNYKNRGGCRQN